ncbi:phosphotransferase [Psychromonas arctica]|uniref:phosphotransferase n=1 Tax=Psychromonas arctica TaxID=168275 RepID=UPI0003F4CA13|nr:phosphotransferase [Psychromonas arctica]
MRNKNNLMVLMRADCSIYIKKYKLIEYMLLKINYLIVNLLLFFRSHITESAYVPYYLTIKKSNITFESAHLNKVNGTYVTVRKDQVVKYYFKDLLDINNILKVLEKNLYCKVYSRDNFIVAKFDKYKKINVNLEYKDIQSLLTNGLYFFDDSSKDMLPNFNMRLKVAIRNNTSLKQKHISFINNSFSKLNEFIEFNQVCHGDVWRENIMLSETKGLVLIDYDKIMMGPKWYDLIHYCFSIRTDKNSPWSYLDNPNEIYKKLPLEMLDNSEGDVLKFSVLIFLIFKCADSNPAPSVFPLEHIERIFSSWSCFLKREL